MNIKIDKKTAIILAASCLILVIAVFYFRASETKVLRIGIFAGNNWNVPQGETYAIIDEVINKFKAENPNVEVKYVSGIKKKIIQNGWRNNLSLAMSLMYSLYYPMISICMPLWVH